MQTWSEHVAFNMAAADRQNATQQLGTAGCPFLQANEMSPSRIDVLMKMPNEKEMNGRQSIKVGW